MTESYVVTVRQGPRISFQLMGERVSGRNSFSRKSLEPQKSILSELLMREENTFKKDEGDSK
jgi:hypothetical protein